MDQQRSKEILEEKQGLHIKFLKTKTLKMNLNIKPTKDYSKIKKKS